MNALNSFAVHDDRQYRNHAKTGRGNMAGSRPPINTLNDYLPEDSMPALLQDLMTTMDGAIKAENINYVAYTFWPSETRNYFNDNIEKVYLDMMSLDDFLVGMREVFDKAKDAGMLLLFRIKMDEIGGLSLNKPPIFYRQERVRMNITKSSRPAAVSS